MYEIVLAIHNILRWVVVIAGVYMIIVSITGLLRNRDYGSMERIGTIIYTSSLDLQLLLGLRFFAIEHIALMVIAIIAAHIGSSRVKKSTGNLNKHRTGLLWIGISLLIVLLSIPWSRALFPGL